MNVERECEEHVTPDIGGKFVAIFGNVTKIITLRWGGGEEMFLEMFVTVMLVSAGTPGE